MSTRKKIRLPYRLLLLTVFSLITVQIFSQDYELREAPFNSKEADFSAIYNGNEIVFCSTRARKQVSFSEDSIHTFYTDLYSVQVQRDGTYGDPEPLKGKVNTLLNEGQATFSSDGTEMYYTANLKIAPGGKGKKTQEYLLGLYRAKKINGDWIPQEPFPYNSANGKYSVAHPCLSPDNQTLYFSSNMPGGKGGSDIYRCRLVNGVWSAPENVGGDINTKGNEFFPFVNENETIFFSSDARPDSEGMDIYYCENESGKYLNTKRLNETINSEYDDFAYYEIRGENKGLLSSNREQDDDNIFLFNKYSRAFVDCLENPETQLCYELKDLTLAELTDLPLKYQWDMGDGTILTGPEVQYCYQNSGDYHVTLCVIDTLTKVVFAAVSETNIHIDSKSRPYIASADTVYIEKSFDFTLNLEEFNEFEIKEISWEFSDGTKYKGPSGIHSISSSGPNQLKCFITGKKNSNGIIPRVCVYKDIYITNDSQFEVESEPVSCCRPSQPKVVIMKSQESTAIRDRTSLDYKLVLVKSDTALALSNTAFKKVKRKIIEYREPDSYVYCVDQASTWSELLPQYREMKNMGVEELMVIQIPADSKGSELTPDKNVKVPAGNTVAYADQSANEPSKNIGNKSTSGIAAENSSGNTNTPKENSSTSMDTLPTMSAIAVNAEKMKFEDCSILIFENEQRITDPQTRFVNVEDEVTEVFREGKYQYLINAGKDEATTNQKITSLQQQGFTGAQLINWKPVNGKVVNNRKELSGSVAAAEKNYYQVKTIPAKDRIPLNNPMFEQIKTTITEIQEGDLYSYVIINTDKRMYALELLEHHNITGDIQVMLDSSSLEAFTSKIVKSGKYIAPKNADKLNIEFSRLSDIKFEYNSDEILEESYATLNYIAAMLKLEDDFSLKINAHTCSIGGASFNQKLSEKRARAVVEYFKQKGIAEQKLISKGYGLSNPVSTNMTERGRAANRRVEFIVVFEIKK